MAATDWRKEGDESKSLGFGVWSLGFRVFMIVGAYYLITSYGHKDPLTVKGFTIIIIRGDNVIFHYYNSGNIFQPQVQTALKSIEKGDKITITNYSVQISDLGIIQADPVEFIIDQRF